jgi:hypothetical protein
MREALSGRITRLALDRESGASEIFEEAIAIFREALAAGVSVQPVARAVCRAQPSMAFVWNLALEMLALDRAPEQLEDFARPGAFRPRGGLDRYRAPAPAGHDLVQPIRRDADRSARREP